MRSGGRVHEREGGGLRGLGLDGGGVRQVNASGVYAVLDSIALRGAPRLACNNTPFREPTAPYQPAARERDC